MRILKRAVDSLRKGHEKEWGGEWWEGLHLSQPDWDMGKEQFCEALDWLIKYVDDWYGD